MRILSKKSFALGQGANPITGTVEEFVTVRGAIQEIPDNLANDRMFKMAVSAGDIVVMSAPIQVSTPIVEKKEETKEEEKEIEFDPITNFKEKLKTMSKENAKLEAEKYGAEWIEDDQLKNNKKRIFEAFKLSLTK